MLLLDLTQANITIEYEYDELSDGELVKDSREYTLGLLTGGGAAPISGNAVNTFINDAFPPEILNNLDTGLMRLVCI